MEQDKKKLMPKLISQDNAWKTVTTLMRFKCQWLEGCDLRKQTVVLRD